MDILVERLLGIMSFVSLIDIIIVAFFIYKIFMLIKDTRAEQLLKGLIVLLFATGISKYLGLSMINWILERAQTILLVALKIVFQQELRRMLEKSGRGGFISYVSFWEDKSAEETVDHIVGAAIDLSAKKTGALIVIERKIGLADIIETGTVLEAKVTRELLKNIFFPNTPLHDGAVIIRKSRIQAAGCFLPLTTSSRVSKDLGTRHRAAIGLSENSDAVVIAVSEETGIISIAEDGVLKRNFNENELKKHLLEKIDIEQNQGIKDIIPWRFKK